MTGRTDLAVSLNKFATDRMPHSVKNTIVSIELFVNNKPTFDELKGTFNGTKDEIILWHWREELFEHPGNWNIMLHKFVEMDHNAMV